MSVRVRGFLGAAAIALSVSPVAGQQPTPLVLTLGEA